MQIIFLIGLIAIAIFFFYATLYKSYRINPVSSPEQALAELMQGNREYNSFWNFLQRAQRKSVATVQKPFAIILSCSDSRVPTEIIFNQLGVGSLFIVRNAGNVADGVVLGTIEYGVTQLGALLIIVLGHERCGAVTATIDHIVTQSPAQSGHIQYIINEISPAAQKILKKYQITDTIDHQVKIDIVNAAVQENVRHTINMLLKHSPIITKAVDKKKIKIIGAYYDLDDGQVKIIS